jgi:hypothetical protein
VDYGKLIGEAWRATWRYRGLWLLGLLAPQSFGGFSFNGSFRMPFGGSPSSGGSSGTDLSSGELGAAIEQATEFLQQNAGLIAGLALVGLVFFVIVWLFFLWLGSVAAGGMAWGTLQVADDRPVTLGEAWRAGTARLGRFFRLNLILGLLAFVVGVVAAIGVIGIVLGIVAAVTGGSRWGLLLVPGGLFVGLLLLVFFLVGVLAAIVVPFAQRIMVLQECGAIDGLKRGWRLLRTRFWTGVLLWLVSVAMGLAFGFGILFAFFLIGVPLVLVGFAIGALVGTGFLLIVYVVVASLFAFALLLVAGAMTSTFQWHFWTRGFLRFSALQAAQTPLSPPPDVPPVVPATA